MTAALFAYGSLVSRESIAQTLGHAAAAPVPARLAGWRRRWSLVRDNARAEKSFEALDGRPFDFCLGLNLERMPESDAASWPNGALVALSPAELRRLDLRELRYDRTDVTADIGAAGGGFDTVYAYVAKRRNFAATPPPRSVVIASYLRACEAAFSDLGAGERDVFAATTGAPPVPVVEARLVRDGIPEGNPRGW